MTNYIDITPETNLPEIISKTGHKLQEALAELIDNSIDAMTDEGLIVNITINNDEIRIHDNWTWMDLEWLKNALTLWHSEKVWKLWRYGLWLKTSCFAMWHVFEIATKKAWEEYEYRVVFNSKELSASKEWKLEYEENRVNIDDHYTDIIINDLKIKNPLKKIDEVINELEMRFSNFIWDDKKDNISIYICWRKLEDVKIEIMDQYKIEINEETNFWTIKWWASLMPKWKQSWWFYWIHCYSNWRLIKPFNKIWFKSHAEYARIFWEIDLDFVELQHDKKDFITDSPEYMEVEERMSHVLKPLLSASRAYRSKDNNPSPINEPKVTKKFWTDIQKWLSKVKDINYSKQTSREVFVWEDVTKVTDEVKNALKTEDNNNIYTIEILNWEKINFSYWFKPLWKNANYLIYDYNPENNCLRIFSNSDSVIFSACKDSDYLSAIHVAEWLSRFILSWWNKKNDLNAYFELYSLILEQTCAILKK